MEKKFNSKGIEFVPKNDVSIDAKLKLNKRFSFVSFIFLENKKWESILHLTAINMGFFIFFTSCHFFKYCKHHTQS